MRQKRYFVLIIVVIGLAGAAIALSTIFLYHGNGPPAASDNLPPSPPLTSTAAIVNTTKNNVNNYNYNVTNSNLFSPTPASNSTSVAKPKPAVLQVAFVRPTFTYAAYRLHGFYNFYQTNGNVLAGKNVTTGLNMLTVKIPHGPFLLHDQKPSEQPGIPQDDYLNAIVDHVKGKSPVPLNASVITDKDVHDGKIFTQNGSNAYSVLFLFHAEYATQAEYSNFKKFVENGGTIVFNDANIFTTEVKYNSTNDTITFVRGHTWQYNGQSAWRVERERWGNETKEWVGSNFLDTSAKERIMFTNDHFGYQHSEEQYVSNPKDKIILDFGAMIEKDEHTSPVDFADGDQNARVAFYELNQSNHGKVIMLGIFAHKLVGDKDFLDYYDSKIIPLVF